MTRRSPYTLAHALIATAVLGVLVFSQGVAVFWKQFLHGLDQVMTPAGLTQSLLVSSIFFATLFGALWLSTRLCGWLRKSEEATAAVAQPPRRLRAMGRAACIAPVLTAVAIGLNWLGAAALEKLLGTAPADQELIRCFTDGHYPLALRALLIVSVLVQAPLLEEPLFRGVIFRGLMRALPTWGAALLSGAIFALVHVNAASFLALTFLGASFALLYARTGTILAPMTAHLLFNAANLGLLFLGFGQQ